MLAVVPIALIAVALAMVHPVVPAGLALAGIGAVLLTRPFAALCMFVAVLLTRPTDFFPAIGALQPAKMLILLSLGLWLGSKLLSRRADLARAPTDRWLAVLTVAVTLSSLQGTNPAESMTMLKDVFLKIVLLYMLMLNIIDRPRRLATFLHVIAAVGVFLGGYASYMKLTGQASIEGSRAALVGLLGDPNDLALTLLMPTQFLLSSAREHRGRARLVYALIAVLVLSGIVSTQSRGGLLGLGAGGFFLMRTVVKSNVVVAGLMGIGLVGVVAVSGMTERKSGAVGHAEVDESAQGRLDAWKAGGRMVLRRPILGVGFGRFADNYEAYSSNVAMWGKHEAHNSYIKAASETGILGFTPFVALVFHTLLSAVRHYRRRDPAEQPSLRSARTALLPMTLSMLVSAFFLSQCWSWFLYILFATVAAANRVLPNTDGEAA